MSHDLLFSMAGTAAMAGWLLLAVVPTRRAWPETVATAIALAIAASYAALIAVYWHAGEGGFGSLADVARLFEHRGLLLAGWVHYLAFDLLVGCWERGEARRIGLPQWLLVPSLLLTFLFGPIGWLSFMGLRLFKLRGPVRASAQT